jgi:3-hydroxy-3-methylglutaryl CoA synthase
MEARAGQCGKKIILLSYGRGEEFYAFLGQRREQTFQFWKK